MITLSDKQIGALLEKKYRVEFIDSALKEVCLQHFIKRAGFTYKVDEQEITDHVLPALAALIKFNTDTNNLLTPSDSDQIRDYIHTAIEEGSRRRLIFGYRCLVSKLNQYERRS